MDFKKCSKWPPSASKHALHRFLTLAAAARTYSSGIVSTISSTAALRSLMDVGFIRRTWPSTHPQRKKSHGLKSGEYGGQPTSDRREMILPQNLSARKFRTTSVQ